MINMMNAVVLGATCQGCDLLGELAENMNAGITSEATKGSENAIERLQAGNELQKSSLRRSLSLVTLSELVTSVTVCDSDISDKNVAHCTADVAQHVSSVSCCGSREQCATDVDGQQEHSLAVSSADCSFTEIPPLSQRLQLNSLQSDSVSGRELAAEEQPLTGSIVHSRRHDLNNGCLKQSSQRTVNSDSAMLRSRRREALKVRAASILSDDVFLDAAELCDVKTKQLKACRSQSIEIENITSEAGSSSGASGADVFQFSNLDVKQQKNVSENDIVTKFQSSLHIADEHENVESVSTNKSCVPVTENSDKIIDEDNYVETDAMASSVNRMIDKYTEQFTGPLSWSPRHCGNFCIETSILSTPSADDSDSSQSDALQVHELSLCDVQNLNNGSRTSLDPISTGSGTDQVVSNIDATGMSDSLFDNSVSPEEKSPLNVSEGGYNISVTENSDTFCNEGDYSIIVID